MALSDWGRGCGGKLDRGALELLLKLNDGDGWDDAAVLAAPPASFTALTVDIVEPIGPNGVVAGRIAAAHALSDLFAVLARPAWCVVGLTTTHRDVASGRSAALIGGVRLAMQQVGAQLVGGHSRFGEVTQLALTVGGTVDEPFVASAVRPGDLLVISDKRLGTGLLTAAVRSGILDEIPEPTLDAMTGTNQSAARWIAANVRTELVSLTDVTGYGLAGALCGATASAGWELDARKLLPLPDVDLAIDAGVGSNLGDANWRDFGESIEFEIAKPSLRARARALLFDPQTAGPLLAVLRPAAREQLSLVGCPLRLVGTIGSDEKRIVRG